VTGWSEYLREAAGDVAGGLSRRNLWGALGWNDLRQRYSGSAFGSLWITANVAMIVACLTLIFAGPLGGELRHYAPYVAIGFALWHPIAACFNEATQVFVLSAETIRNAPLPLSLQVLRLVWRNALGMAHAFAVVPIVLLLFGVAPAASAWSVVPALALLFFTLFWASLLLGLAGARFRDVGPIVANLLQLLFFLTPIFWLPAALDPRIGWLATFNPLFAFIDIVRAPLIGESPASTSWPIALAAAALAATAGFGALAALRRRVAYWV
jgi:ABC-type polysaccharide/polyol phosphate export permease